MRLYNLQAVEKLNLSTLEFPMQISNSTLSACSLSTARMHMFTSTYCYFGFMQANLHG